MSSMKYNVSFDQRPQQQGLFLLFSFQKPVRFFISLRHHKKDRENGLFLLPSGY
jgi:hypothetical protein